MRCRVEQRVVDFTEFRPHGPGQPFLIEGEPGVDAWLVAPGVQAVPAVPAGQPDRDQAVDRSGAAVVVGQLPVAEGGGDSSARSSAASAMALAWQMPLRVASTSEARQVGRGSPESAECGISSRTWW